MYKLLFVDDEKRVLEAIRDSIEWEKLNTKVVGWCDNAISALQILINEPVDILITDIKMPVMDGIELVKRATEMYPFIESLILSGYEEFELARSAIEIGVHSYLVKPFKKEELEEKVQQCIEKIEKASCSTPYWMGERQRQIEQIYEALLDVQIENDERDCEKIRKIAKESRDYSLLREAAIMLVTQRDVELQKIKALMLELSHAQDSEALIAQIAELLRLLAQDSQSRDPIVDRMICYTNENYQMPGLTVQYIAEQEIHLTPKYIGKRFLKEMNMKYSEYLLKVRMEKAMELLHSRDVSAEEIAESIGFGNNTQYFYRLFRQYTRKTFKSYKDSMKHI